MKNEQKRKTELKKERIRNIFFTLRYSFKLESLGASMIKKFMPAYVMKVGGLTKDISLQLIMVLNYPKSEKKKKKLRT